MKMNLIEILHIYAQFTNLIFESLSSTKEKSAKSIIIKKHENVAMILFANDHACAAVNFEKLHDFLHVKYFFKMTFDSIYLNFQKTYAFIENLNMIEFNEKSKKIKFSIKH